MKGARQVLAVGGVDSRLAADGRVDLTRQRRRDSDPGNAAEVGRGDEARDVRRRPAAEGDDRAVAADGELTPEPLHDGEGLCALAGRKRVKRRVERQGVQLGHALVPQDGGRARRVRDSPEADPERREQHAVGVLGDAVGRFCVRLLPRLVELPEIVLPLRQRAARPAHALPGGLDADVEVDGERVGAQALAVERRQDGASAERDHRRGAGERLCEHALLDPPELGLPALEELRNRAVPPLDHPVEVDERPRRPLRDARAHRRLAGPHEAGQRKMPL